MNYAARTSVSPSVGPRHRLRAVLLRATYCSVTLFVRESRPNNFTEDTGIPNLDVRI
jgi:hypothetical protein